MVSSRCMMRRQLQWALRLLQVPVGLGAAREFVSFVWLVSDDEQEGEKQEVQLMSLHAAKGKEFPVRGALAGSWLCCGTVVAAEGKGIM
jgi:hypothetical protein